MYLRPHLVFLVVSLLVAAFVQPAFSECVRCADSQMLCGPYCMLEVCSRLGVPSDLSEMKELCRYDGVTGTTLAGLLSAATAKGLEAVAVKLSLADPLQWTYPAVAHLWSNHFVLVEPGDADMVKVTTAPPGNIKGEVTIHTNDPGEPQIELPAYAYVER